MMADFELFVFNDADKILSEKGLLQEIMAIMKKIRRIDHKEIQKEFQSRGWQLERRIFPETSWAWDAFKNKVAVSVELSLIDAVHRDFLRAILAHKRGELDALVYVTSTYKEPKYKNVKRDITIFKTILPFPILLLGLKEN